MKKLDDKEQAMYIAKKFQKRMLIPKIFFIIFTIYWVVGLLFCIIYIPIASICPYCHSFQKFNGKPFEIDANNLTYSRGVSPFSKDYCIACKAPLSPKAVEHMYSKIADE